MRSIGGLLFFFGLGSVILDLFNYQFAILAPIEEYQPAAGIVLAVIGAVLVGLGVQQDQNAKRKAEAEMASMAPVTMATDPMATSSAPMAAAATPAAEPSWSSTPTTPPPASPAPDAASAPAPAPDVTVTTDQVRSDDMGTSERTDPDRPA